MNENQNNNQVNNEYQDPRSINAEVIGELRKDKIGKPILALEIFGLLILVLLFVPFVTKMLQDENSALYKLIYGEVTDIVTPGNNNPVNEFLNGGEPQAMVSSTKMRFNNLVLKDFSLSEGIITCTIYSYTDVINLDESGYFLEIYSNSEKLLSAIKLTGTYDFEEKVVELSNRNLNFNPKFSYYAKVVDMKEEDYPAVTLSTDESGIGSLTCTKDNQTLEYTFKNNYLINVKDTVKVNFTDNSQNEYLNAKKLYDEKSILLGDVATVSEISDGFVFNANINLEAPDYKYPDKLNDYNYFVLDTQVKVIDYTLKGKGFDCK